MLLISIFSFSYNVFYSFQKDEFPMIIRAVFNFSSTSNTLLTVIRSPKFCLLISSLNILLFTIQSRLLTTLKKKALENTVGKGENAGNKHFLLFPQCFLLHQREKSSFKQHLICRLHVLSIWFHPIFCRLVKS